MINSSNDRKKILDELSFPDPLKVFSNLFRKAKEKDEFEFCCTLLRIRGCQDGGWDPMTESVQLIDQTIAVLNSPIDEFFRRRLMLFLYCHLCEMNDLYQVIANMLLICEGERYHIDAINAGEKLPKGWDKDFDCTGDALRVSNLARNAGMEDVAAIFSSAFIRQVRNGFFHSQYTLAGDEFRLTNLPMLSGVRVRYVQESGTSYDEITKSVRIDWLVPRIQLAVNTALAVINLVNESMRCYTESKLIQGRMGPDESYVELTLLANKNGLYGFEGGG